MTYDTIAIPGGFIKLMRSEATRELLKDAKAFALLTQIALRARRTDEFNIHGLKPGQALIGDHGNCGLTRQEYRSALRRLEGYGLITYETTTRGTIATLCTNVIYDINGSTDNQPPNQQATSEQPSGNQRPTTNKNEKNEKKEKKGPPVCFSGSGSGVRSGASAPPTFAEMDRQRAACALAEAQEEFLHDDEA